MNERSTTPAGASVNRKKQKRRQKQASKAATTQQQNVGSHDAQDDYDEAVAPTKQGFSTVPDDEPDSPYEDDYYPGPEVYDPFDGKRLAGSDEENGYGYEPSFPTANGTSSYRMDDGNQGKKRSKRKNKPKQQATEQELASQNQQLPHQDLHSSSAWTYAPPPPPPPPAMSDDALRSVHRSISKDPIWTTSTEEERPKIKSFWLKLVRKQQRGLLRLDKGDVLKKMKEQQKHSCSCSVCGRKRNAIEEELEKLYDAYFQELEGFSRLNKGARPSFTPRRQFFPPARTDKGIDGSSSRIRELRDDDQYDEVDDDLSEDEYDDEYNVASNAASDLSTFGDSLSVEG